MKLIVSLVSLFMWGAPVSYGYYPSINEENLSTGIQKTDDTVLTLVPVSATIEDAQGCYTSEHFDSPSMTVYDEGTRVTIAWSGDVIPLKQGAYDKDTYMQSATQNGMSVNIVAHRNSSTQKIFMVTIKIKNLQGSVKIVFKERKYNFNIW